ncbi:hypothetical protein ACFV4M_03915 [Kitasatospora indigofera]|uniref:hypothetical protein n=1 Tax=Kitasatospora indigofera TaxID=67307 RepID=UPI00364BBEE5
MTDWQRVCWWGLGVVGAGAAVGLVVWVTAAHPNGAGQAWGAVGAVAGVAAVVVALWQLRSTAPVSSASSIPSAGPMSGSGGAIVADGEVSGSSTSAGGPVPAPAPGPAAGMHGSSGAIVSGGGVTDSHTEYRP